MPGKILFITLSNIGDVILTLPALDYLLEKYPGSKVTVLAGERACGVFEGHPAVEKFIPFDKRAPLREKARLFFALQKERFDVVIDLRNSMLGVLLKAKIKTSPFRHLPRDIRHMSKKHLYKIPNPNGSAPLTIGPERSRRAKSEILNKPGIQNPKNGIYINVSDEQWAEDLLRENGISKNERIVLISAGARSATKRWPKERWLELIRRIPGVRFLLIGSNEDKEINYYICASSQGKAVDLSGKTSIGQLGALLKKSELLISNDSAPMHLASYLGVPVAAIFGPTDETKYGPWSEGSVVLKKEIFCRPCAKAQCRYGTVECLSAIRVDDVLRQANTLLNPKSEIRNPQQIKKSETQNHKRILIVRTDRIGDVLLSTPVIQAMREAYPQSYIAVMVSPYAREIVEGNPYLDKIIIYDKDGQHKSWAGSFEFARELKKEKFDLALILHPTNRVHLVTFLAGIKKRVGYDRKMGFLLTDRLRHDKQTGQRHESEYSLDFARYLGIEAHNLRPFMPLKQSSQLLRGRILQDAGIGAGDRLLAVHPAASCRSKIWPVESFAEAADKLAQNYGLKVVIVAGPKDLSLAKELQKQMKHPALNLAGKCSVSELASILKECVLFISNDSGPVHIASALDVPVISIFGRNQAGLSPRRWGPLGDNSRVLHKEVGCVTCLAHNCIKEFACLKAVTVDDVLSAAASLLKA